MTSPAVDRTRAALRQVRHAPADLWRPVYEQAMATAYEEGRVDDLADLALLAAGRLEAQGEYDGALAEVEFASGMAGDVPDASAYLMCAKAFYLALANKCAAAAQELERARVLITHESSRQARLGLEVHSAIASCIALEDVEPARITSRVASAEREGFPWLATGLETSLVPWMFATGRRVEARPWINALRVQASEQDHPWRQADADSFSYADESARGSHHSGGLAGKAPASGNDNRNARWRQTILNIHEAAVCGDLELAAGRVVTLAELRPMMSPGFADGAHTYKALIRALGYVELIDHLDTPDDVTLLNLSAALAGAEAVAIAGSQAEAVRWRRWTERMLPQHVTTALEWPASASRVLGLLSVRNGDVRRGVRLMRKAIHWAASAGYRLECGIARVQLAEVLSLQREPAPERTSSRLREAGRAQLTQLGVDPTLHAYAANRALALGRQVETSPRLTPREVEVLTLLADGVSYKQTAARLGIQWRTVQVHAHRIYAKLGVSGRVQAAKRATELQILG